MLLLGNIGVLEPALRPELARVGAPERGGRVHVPDRHGHLLALANGDVVDEIASERADGLGEGDDVVLRSLKVGRSFSVRTNLGIWGRDARHDLSWEEEHAGGGSRVRLRRGNANRTRS